MPSPDKKEKIKAKPPVPTTMTVTANGASSGLADPQLLRKIDRLFECNVGNYIDLPQLVVVGDQSSGKSSVLEGITGLPFPRDSGLCTRFATQITFRRAPVDCITVSIIPAKDASPQHAATVSVWQKADLHNLDSRTFSAIMQEVCLSSCLLRIHTLTMHHIRLNKSWVSLTAKARPAPFPKTS